MQAHSKKILYLLGLLITNALFLSWNALRCFNFYDMGFSLDGGWRILLGQQPYVDFFYFSGPIHLYLHALFFKIFGFGTSAILAYLIFSHSILITGVFFFCNKWSDIWTTLLLTILTITSFYWPISHPWHNQTADIFGLLALGLILYHWPLSSQRQAMITSFWAGLLVILSLLTKTNAGLLYIAFITILLIFSSFRKSALLAYFIGLIISFGLCGLFLIKNIPLFWEQISAYSQMMGHTRLQRLLVPQNWLTNYYWLPLALIVFNILLSKTKKLFNLFLSIGFYTLCILSLYSSDVLIEANVFLWGPFLIIAFWILNYLQSDKLGFNKFIQISKYGLMLISLGLICVAVKYGFELKVWAYSDKHPIGEYAIQSEAIKGWKTHAWIGKVLDDMADYIKRNIPKDDSLLIATDLQILNALTGRDSYRGIPVFVFQKNHMPIPGAQLNKVKDQLINNPPQWILVDLSSYINEIPYLGLDISIKKNYAPVHTSGPYALFRKIY